MAITHKKWLHNIKKYDSAEFETLILNIIWCDINLQVSSLSNLWGLLASMKDA